MITLGRLEVLLFTGQITDDEYAKRKDAYIEKLIDLYVNGIIDKEEFNELLYR